MYYYYQLMAGGVRPKPKPKMGEIIREEEQ
jgi:hypothetical protein